jgi:predicted transglutaminase-like protease
MYQSRDISEIRNKIEFVKTLINGKSFSFDSCGGTVTDTMKLKMLEREYLIQEGQVIPELV